MAFLFEESLMREALPDAALLPYAAPTNPYHRLLLFAVRRMAAGGIADAHAAHALFTGFGLGYRRPLVLLRAFMTELSRVSAQRLTVAPCCCARMTRDEEAVLRLVAQAPEMPDNVHEALAAMLHVRTCLGVLSSAQAVAIAFRDLGMPLDLDDCISCNRDDPF